MRKLFNFKLSISNFISHFQLDLLEFLSRAIVTNQIYPDSPFYTLKLLIENGRPITIVAPVIIVSIYYFIYAGVSFTFVKIINYLLLVFGVISLRMGINNVNNVYDVEVDIINKPHRPIPRGELEKEVAFITGTIIQFLSLFVFMLLGFHAFLLGLSFVVAGWMYNVDHGLKNYFPINNLIIGYVRGFGYLLPLLILQVHIESEHIIFAFAIMLYIFGSINSKDINDVEGDKANNRQTLPILLGEKNQYLALFSAPFVFFPPLIFTIGVMNGTYSSYYLLLLLALPLDLTILFFIWKSSTSEHFENNIAWVLMIVTYLSHHILFGMILLHNS